MGKRLDWIDTLKGIAMIMVVWGHCGSSNVFYNGLYYVHLPIFISVSGYLLAAGSSWRKRTLWQNIQYRATQLLYPYMGMGALRIVFLYIEHLVVGSKFSLRTQLRLLLMMENGANWFLPSLFFATVIFIAIDKVIKGSKYGILAELVLGILVVWGIRRFMRLETIEQLYNHKLFLCRLLYRMIWQVGKVGAFVSFLSLGYLLNGIIENFRCMISTPPPENWRHLSNLVLCNVFRCMQLSNGQFTYYSMGFNVKLCYAHFSCSCFCDIRHGVDRNLVVSVGNDGQKNTDY